VGVLAIDGAGNHLVASSCSCGRPTPTAGSARTIDSAERAAAAGSSPGSAATNEALRGGRAAGCRGAGPPVSTHVELRSRNARRTAANLQRPNNNHHHH
jgi:hypothetical protein